MLLTNNHFTPIIGIDIHFNTLPPFNPIHPYIGIVMDIMDYIPFIGSTVNVNSIPRGVTDTGGNILTFVHIPLFTGPFAMMPMIGHESMNFFGSVNSYIEGRRISPKGYMKMTCNDIGIPLSLTPGKKMRPIPSLFAPTSFSLPIPTGMPVNIAGPYVPDLMGMLINLIAGYGFGALFKVLGKAMSKLLKKLNKLAKKAFGKSNRLSKFLCKHGFEPVDLIQGIVFYEYVDFELPGPIPLVWERVWNSDAENEHQLGHGYHHSYDLPMKIVYDDQVIAVCLPDGRTCGFPILEDGQEFYHRMERLTLKREGNNYNLYHHTKKLNYHYIPVDSEYYVPVRINNAAGQAVNLFYSGKSLVGITDSCGRVITFDLDYQNRITGIYLESLKGRSLLVAYEYNEAGDLAVIKDALLQAVTIEYDNHLMVAKTDRNGQTFYWDYDAEKRCIHTWGDEGLLEGWLEYHPELGYNIITDALGNQSVYYYNEDFLCTQIKDALGNSKFYEYTETFELYREIDEEGCLTGYTYDDKGNLTGVIQPDSAQYTYVYDVDDRLIIANDPEGGTTIWNYDEEGNLKTTIAPDKAITAFSYNESGLVSEIRDVNKGVTQLEYDTEFNLVKLILPYGEIATWTYNEKGEVEKAVNPEGGVQKFSYDPLGRVTQIIHPDHTSVQLRYNAYDEVIHAKDSDHDVKFAYTPLGSLKMREENGVKVEFNYNRNEELINVKNEHDELYRFIRNANGDVVQEIGFDNLSRQYSRDKSGNLLFVERPGKRWTKFENDALGRIIRAEYFDGTWEVFSYNKRGQLIEAVNSEMTVKLQRDNVGRIIKETQGQHSVESAYNKNGSKTAILSSLGAQITHEYNKMGKLATTCAKTSLLESSWEMKLQHNAMGQEVSRIMSGGIESYWEYDDTGRPTAHSVNARGRVQRQKKYSWSANNRLWRVMNELTGTEIGYSHDAFGNLAWAKYENGQYDYKLLDEVGNLYKIKHKSDKEYGAGGKLLRDTEYTYTYDDEGNLIAKNGKDSWKYDWLGNGMLKAVTKPDTTLVTFEYDAIGRRTAKIVKDTICRFVWNANIPLHEWNYDIINRPQWLVDENGFLIQDREEPKPHNLITWIFEEGTFKLTAKIEGDKKYSIITDYLGTPCEAFDENGEKVWEAELDIYGKIRKLEGDKCFIPFRYQGQYEDIETGLYYNRFRYYDCNTGNYIKQDPIGILGGSRLYGYVKDSTILVDVFGLMPLANPVNQGHHVVPHQAATDLGIKPFNSQTGVPSMYWDDSQFSTGNNHSAMHGYNNIGSDTKPMVKASQIQKKGLTNDQWLGTLEKHYNNPAIQQYKGDLHIINADGTKGKLIKANVSPSEAWDLTKKWAKDKGYDIKCS